LDGRLQFDDETGSVRPIVLPADDDVATGGIVAMVVEVSALELKLDTHSFPVGSNSPLGLAIRERGGHAFDDIAKLMGNDSEQKYDALLVDRSMLKAAKVEKGAVSASGSEWNGPPHSM
jgi:hypothetical protein